jgi:hypothetical protein
LPDVWKHYLSGKSVETESFSYLGPEKQIFNCKFSYRWGNNNDYISQIKGRTAMKKTKYLQVVGSFLFIFSLFLITVYSGQAVAADVDTDLPGMNLRSFDPNENPQLCEAECKQDPQCKAWTYVRPGVQGPTARCWIKSGVPSPVVNKCCISGVKESPLKQIVPEIKGLAPTNGQKSQSSSMSTWCKENPDDPDCNTDSSKKVPAVGEPCTGWYTGGFGNKRLTCLETCLSVGKKPVAAGKKGGVTKYYVCAGRLSGKYVNEHFRVGYNVGPNWSHACWVGIDGKEIGLERYECLCSDEDIYIGSIM